MSVPTLPIELTDVIIEHLWNSVFDADLSFFVTLCLLSKRYKAIMYRRRKTVQQTLGLLYNYTSVSGGSVDPFHNPYVNREFALSNMLHNVFHDKLLHEDRLLASVLWTHRSWLRAQMTPQEFGFGVSNTWYSSEASFWPKELDTFCVLGNVSSGTDHFDYAIMRDGEGVVFLRNDGKQFRATVTRESISIHSV